MESTPSSSSAPAPAGLTAAHQSALGLAMNQSTNLWLMTLAYLPFSLVLAGWAAYPTVTGSTIPVLDTLVAMAISAAGLATTILWGGSTLRALKMQRYWLLVARELESQACAGTDYLRRAMALDGGEPAIVSQERVRLDPMERPMAVGPLHISFGLFLVTFIFLLIMNMMRFGRVL